MVGLFSIPQPVLAANEAWDIIGGVENVIPLISILILVVAGVVCIRELVTRGRIIAIIGLIAATAFIFSVYNLENMRNIGSGIKAYLKMNTTTQNQNESQQNQPEPINSKMNP